MIRRIALSAAATTLSVGAMAAAAPMAQAATPAAVAVAQASTPCTTVTTSGPLTLTTTFSSGGTITVSPVVAIPFIGNVTLGPYSGNPSLGFSDTFNWGTVKGSLSFAAQNNQVVADYTLTIWTGTLTGSVPLINC